MPDPKTFNCPSCGAALDAPAEDAKEIKCAFCGNTVIVPRSLRNQALTPEQMRQKSSEYFFLGTLGEILPIFKFLAQYPKIAAVVLGGIWVLAMLLVFLVSSPFSRHSSAAPTIPSEFVGMMGTAVAMKQTVDQAKTPQAALGFGGEGTAPGLFQKASKVAVDASGNVYVTDDKNYRVQKFDATGNYRGGWTITDPDATKYNWSFDALASDRAGNVYVTLGHMILKYDGVTGKLLNKYSGHVYWSATPLADGSGIIGTASGSTQDDLVKLDAEGKEVWYRAGVITSQPGGKAPFRLKIAVDGLGNIFALQDDEGAIYKYTPDGKFVTKFGSKGGQPGQFNAPGGINYIAVDNHSNVYVSDWADLYIFDMTGRYIKKIDVLTSVGGVPHDLIINDKNELFIVQSNNKIYKILLGNP